MELVLALVIAGLLLVLVLVALRPKTAATIDPAALQQAVGDRLYQDNQQTQTSLQDIRERLVLVQTAQSQLRNLSGQMATLERTLGSGSTRGLYGEQQLEELVTAILPLQRLRFQAQLSNGKRPDLLILLPNPPGPLVVDAKFPLAAFEELHAAETHADKRTAGKRLERHLIGHLRDIAARYIIPGETADQAILFLPSDALFASVHAHARLAVEESHRCRVWITAPASLAATLTTLRAVVRDVETAENLSHIQSEVSGLLDDLERMTSTITALERHFGAAQRDIDQLRGLRDSVGDRASNIAEPSGRTSPQLSLVRK